MHEKEKRPSPLDGKSILILESLDVTEYLSTILESMGASTESINLEIIQYVLEDSLQQSEFDLCIFHASTNKELMQASKISKSGIPLLMIKRISGAINPNVESFIEENQTQYIDKWGGDWVSRLIDLSIQMLLES